MLLVLPKQRFALQAAEYAGMFLVLASVKDDEVL